MALHRFEEQAERKLRERQIAPSAGSWEKLEDKLGKDEGLQTINKMVDDSIKTEEASKLDKAATRNLKKHTKFKPKQNRPSRGPGLKS